MDDFKKIGLIYESLNKEISVESIAKKHGVSVEKVMEKLKGGMKIEMEHTKDKKTAETIASHHLNELLDYYERLKKIED
jgi:uncharacterized protein YktB (UPF0637 family)